MRTRSPTPSQMSGPPVYGEHGRDPKVEDDVSVEKRGAYCYVVNERGEPVVNERGEPVVTERGERVG